ncbi:hypothetical protein FAM09_28645 [Niastella caeni]|uniref:Uncharacterized protein n=1 Tax=Niastella caeni TaxID=2569763 RepID=A0A4S8HAE1_9BACT|nr:hypothetical protein [Niastella caeni]THU31595.1 hypothetical protein FAM09_28645 [Niastella caeni]
MTTNNENWSTEWATFFDEYAGDFHPTFKQKLARQLFEKGSKETGIRGFEKYDFMLLVGQEDLRLQQIDENMFAMISFISPASSSHSAWIYWNAAGADIVNIHTQDVSTIDIAFHWGGNFPIEEVMHFVKPYKKEKKNKTNLHFDVDYYYNTFPDIFLQIVFLNPPSQQLIETMNSGIADFANTWNRTHSDKVINYIHSLIARGDNMYELVADMGLDNSPQIIGSLLTVLSNHVPPDVISKVSVK